MKITLRIAAVVLAFLGGLAFRCWDHFDGVPGTRYVPNGHGWTGGPNVLQLTAFLWLVAGAVACLLLSLGDGLERSFDTVTLSPAGTFGKANSRSRGLVPAVALGVRGGQEVPVSIAALGGLGLTGPGTTAAARAILAGVLAQAAQPAQARSKSS